jgi:hypothetical protein
MRSLSTALVLFACGASAQQQQLASANYWDRCYGETEPPSDAVAAAEPSGASTVYVVTPPIWVDPKAPPANHAQSPAGPLGPVAVAPTGDPGAAAGYALIAVAVVAVAALPVVVYALDNEPPPRVLRRFNCASFTFDGSGGAEGNARSPWLGIAAARVRVAYQYLGTEIRFSGSPRNGVGDFSVHGLLRLKPKEHLEGAIALGYQRSYFGGSMREGFEIGLPHQYTLWRQRGRELQLEVRPGVFITTVKTVDLSVDVAILIPVLERMSLRLGTRVFTHDLQPMFGFSGGLSVHL